jgi:hypothetical protein
MNCRLLRGSGFWIQPADGFRKLAQRRRLRRVQPILRATDKEKLSNCPQIKGINRIKNVKASS